MHTRRKIILTCFITATIAAAAAAAAAAAVAITITCHWFFLAPFHIYDHRAIHRVST